MENRLQKLTVSRPYHIAARSSYIISLWMNNHLQKLTRTTAKRIRSKTDIYGGNNNTNDCRRIASQSLRLEVLGLGAVRIWLGYRASFSVSIPYISHQSNWMGAVRIWQGAVMIWLGYRASFSVSIPYISHPARHRQWCPVELAPSCCKRK